MKQCSDCDRSDPTAPSGVSSAPWMLHFEVASKCQEQIKNSSSMAKESFAQKCSVVLEEARAEAMLKIRQVQARQANTNNWTENGEEAQTDGTNTERLQELINRERPQVEMQETSYFSGEWNDMNFVSVNITPTFSPLHLPFSHLAT